MKQADVIIIGAGLAGLSLGALLAGDTERRVLLAEKAGDAGGRVRVMEKDGFLLDWGIHAMLHGGAGTLASIVRKTGGRLRVGPAGMCLAHDSRFEPLISEKLLFQFTGGQSVSPTDFGKIAWRLIRGGRDELRRVRGMSLADWVHEVRPSPRMERMVRAVGVGLFAVDDLNDASAWECFRFFRRVASTGAAFGYPVGGWRAVVDALQRPISRSRNAEIRFGTHVTDIEIEGAGATGVRLADGEKWTAKIVVWAGPAQKLPAALPACALDAKDKERLLGLRSTYGVNIDFALERPVTSDRRCIVTLDPPTLGWFVSNIEPSMAPRGKQLLTTFSPVSPGHWPDRNYRIERLSTIRNTYLDLFPEIERYLIWERPLETLVNAARVDTGQMRDHRPGPLVPGVKNLLLIGDATSGRGFGAEIAASSALSAFNIIRHNLREEPSQCFVT